MKNKFCHHCGKAMPLDANFCGSCGTNLNSLAATPPPVKKPQETIRPFTPRHDDDDDDEISVDRMDHLRTNMTQLDVEIVTHKPPQETFATVSMQRPFDEPPRDGPPKVDRKQFLEDFKKEAGTLKN